MHSSREIPAESTSIKPFWSQAACWRWELLLWAKALISANSRALPSDVITCLSFPHHLSFSCFRTPGTPLTNWRSFWILNIINHIMFITCFFPPQSLKSLACLISRPSARAFRGTWAYNSCWNQITTTSPQWGLKPYISETKQRSSPARKLLQYQRTPNRNEVLATRASNLSLGNKMRQLEITTQHLSFSLRLMEMSSILL